MRTDAESCQVDGHSYPLSGQCVEKRERPRKNDIDRHGGDLSGQAWVNADDLNLFTCRVTLLSMGEMPA